MSPSNARPFKVRPDLLDPVTDSFHLNFSDHHQHNADQSVQMTKNIDKH